MKPMLRRELHPTATVPQDLAGPVIDFRSSDETLDRYQEVISVTGWKLDNYRKNPIVQNAHSYSSLSDTIGKSLITEVRSASSPYLFQRVLFAVEENPMAKVAYGLYKGGFLNAVSVGFLPIRWKTPAPEGQSSSSSIRRIYLEQELLEVSAVSMPANPNAISMALKAGAVERGDMKELIQLLNHFCNQKADRISDTRALGPAIDEAQLLQLKKQLQEIRAIFRRS